MAAASSCLCMRRDPLLGNSGPWMPESFPTVSSTAYGAGPPRNESFCHLRALFPRTFLFLQLRHLRRLLCGPPLYRASCGLGRRLRGARCLAPASAPASDGRRLGVLVSRSIHSNGNGTRVTSACFND